MRLTTKILNINAHYPIVLLNKKDADYLGVVSPDRVVLKKGLKKVSAFVDITEKDYILPKGFIGLYDGFPFKDNVEIEVKVGEKPKSIPFIKKKLAGKELSAKEIDAIVDDINNDRISDIELSSFLTAIYLNGFNMKETIDLTKAMIRHGSRLKWKKGIIVDKHSIGGIPGNRVTPIVVSILAAMGFVVPKTSSRAITSPAGTADTMEVFCDVSFSLDEIRKIVNKTNGCLVWGGALDLAPVDDKLIRVEHPLSIDPEGQMLASVMSKKASAGSKYVVIDIPVGDGAKIKSYQEGEILANKFKILGEELGMVVRCSLSKGNEPIGWGIGPVLEAIDILDVLKGHGPQDLREKSLELVSMILEMTKKGSYEDAARFLDDGTALKKFKEIVEAQNGSIDKNFHAMLGKYKKDVYSDKKGEVLEINNKEIAKLAKLAGAPFLKGSGVRINKKEGDIVNKGDLLFSVFSESEEKFKEVKAYLKKNNPFNIGHVDGIIVEEL